MEQLSEKSFEHLAIQKMIHMDFAYLMSLISSYKTLNMIHPNNPLYQYICYFTPYRPKINEKDKKVLLQSNQNYVSMTNAIRNLKKVKNSSKPIYKDQVIRFDLKLSKELQRFQKFEINSRNEGYNKHVTLIQKHVRSFLKRISVIRIIDSIIIEKCLQCIIKIQREFKRFKCRRDFKVNHLIKKIINYRNEKSDLLKTILYTYETKINARNKILIKEFLIQRQESASLIQRVYKNRKFREYILKLIYDEKNKYTLVYPLYAKKVQLKIFLDKKMKVFNTYDYELCPIRKVFVLNINSSDFPPGKYFCQLFVDNYLSSDERYPQIQGKDGKFYSLIDFYQAGTNDSFNNLNNSINLNSSYNNNEINEPVNSNYLFNNFNNNNNNFNNNNNNFNNNNNNFNNNSSIFSNNNNKNFNNNNNNFNNNNFNNNFNDNNFISNNNNFNNSSFNNSNNNFNNSSFMNGKNFNNKNGINNNNMINNYQAFNNFNNGNNNNNNFFNNMNYGMNQFNNYNMGNNGYNFNNYRKYSNNDDSFFSLQKNLTGQMNEYRNVK